jgi:YggT family protein
VVLTLIANVLLFVLTVFLIAMWARFILDWVRLLARRWRPRGVALVLAEASYTVTDPPIRLVRRVVPPLRIGGAALDFAWSIVLLLCLILMAVVRSIG